MPEIKSGYEYGARDLADIVFSPFTDFINSANESRKKSNITFFFQCINIFLVFNFSIKILPVLGNIKKYISITDTAYLKNFFIVILLIFILKVLSKNIDISRLFKFNFYATIAIGILFFSLALGIRFTDKIKIFIKKYV